MTPEEINTIIKQAENGDISAMNQLTHMYAEREEYPAALRWFKILIQKDNNPQSNMYHKTKYDKSLCENIVSIFDKSLFESDLETLLTIIPKSGISLFDDAIIFGSNQTREYVREIRRILKEDEVIQRKERECREKEIQEQKCLAQEKQLISIVEKNRDGNGPFWLEKNKRFVVPNGTKEIGKNAFTGCEYIIFIEIPEGVKRIGDRAFSRCKHLSSVKIPSSVENVGQEIFYQTGTICKIVVPIGTKQKFAHMDGLKEYTSIIVEE